MLNWLYFHSPFWFSYFRSPIGIGIRKKLNDVLSLLTLMGLVLLTDIANHISE
jgi:hypothetical protein